MRQLLFLLRQLLKVFFLQQNSPHSAQDFLFPDDLSQSDNLMHQLRIIVLRSLLLFGVLLLFFEFNICVTDAFDFLIQRTNFILNLLSHSFTNIISVLTVCNFLFSNFLVFVEDSFVEVSPDLLSYVSLHQVVVVLQGGQLS